MADDDQVKGKAENLKGRIKQAFGAMTGNKGKEAEGVGERVEGAVREKLGDAKSDAKTPPEDEDEDT
jgi:uncharacterized protein YjbJ (UPF0337 family)